MHTANRDGEEYSSSSVVRNVGARGMCYSGMEMSDLPFIGIGERGERAASEGETKRQRRSKQPAAEGLHRSHSNSTFSSFRVTFRIPIVRGKNLDIGSAHSGNPWRIMTR